MCSKVSNDVYTCSICGSQISWEIPDKVHGEIWCCEKCGECFCAKCFIDKFGQDAYMRMVQGYDWIYCPKCWGKNLMGSEEAIMNILLQVRAEMEAEYGEELQGHCIEASDRIIAAMKSSGIEYDSVVSAEGWCVYDDDSWCSDAGYDAHTWVELVLKGTKLYLDVTADQFNYGMDPGRKYPKVMLHRGLPWGMVYEKPEDDVY